MKSKLPPNKSHQLNPIPSKAEIRPKSLLAKLKNSRDMDHYRLKFTGGTPAVLPPDLREAVDMLYIEGRTQALVATILDAILSFKQSVFLLSRADCQTMLDMNNNDLFKPFSLTSGAFKRAYQGAIAELTDKNDYLRVTIPNGRKPMVVEVIDAELLGLIGESDPDYVLSVFQSVGLQVTDFRFQSSVFSLQSSDCRLQDTGYSLQGGRAVVGAQGHIEPIEFELPSDVPSTKVGV